MRELDAIFAGELSGHYYFKDNSFAESATLAVLRVLNVMARTGKTLHDLATALRTYAHSGEINSTVRDASQVMTRLREEYASGSLHELDGIKISFDDWWFNVRSSNTEPVLRLNCEAKTENMMIQRRDELLRLIREG
jgi:phosphomannomutase